jgi:hypothetical protein
MMKIGPAVAVAAAFAIASPVCAQDAVQWRVEDGGNGHWYGLSTTASSAIVADATSRLKGATLAIVTSDAENLFLRQLVQKSPGLQSAWIGGYQDLLDAAYLEPAGAWKWLDGQPLSNFSAWDTTYSEPNNANGAQEDWIEMTRLGTWNDAARSLNRVAVMEWSADCNGDGVVDYGQIRDGTFPDVNANGVPDCCDQAESCTPCPGDVTNGGTVDAADLSILLAAWGTNGQGEFDTDLNGDGLVDGGDLALVLGGWGACP